MEDYRDIYRGVASDCLDDDLTVANLELPVDPTRPEEGYPLFNGSIPYVRAALESGVDLLSAANNHAFDGGLVGVFQTIRSLESLRRAGPQPLAYSGIRGNDRVAFAPEAVSVRGVRVGFIAVTQFLNQAGGDPWIHVVDYTDPRAVAAFLEQVRIMSPMFDMLIVSYHGDREYVQEPSPRKREFFLRVVGAGATIVYSHHPHVVQGYEVIKVGGRDRLIMYSMGNFISGMTWELDPSQVDNRYAPTGEAYMLHVEVVCGQSGCSVSRTESVPIANFRNEKGEMVVGRMRDLVQTAGGLTPAWRKYYAERLSRMERFLAESTTVTALSGSERYVSAR
jgi:poly-gamma-glutamate capsule biosynthesis protein CapA/YwtB (metallophosphatase superfamily)